MREPWGPISSPVVFVHRLVAARRQCQISARQEASPMTVMGRGDNGSRGRKFIESRVTFGNR